MGNAVNWATGGSWAPTSDAGQKAAQAALDKALADQEKQKQQLKSQQQAQQAQLNAKKLLSLRLLGGASGLLNDQSQLSSLLGG